MLEDFDSIHRRLFFQLGLLEPGRDQGRKGQLSIPIETGPCLLHLTFGGLLFFFFNFFKKKKIVHIIKKPRGLCPIPVRTARRTTQIHHNILLLLRLHSTSGITHAVVCQPSFIRARPQSARISEMYVYALSLYAGFLVSFFLPCI